MAIYTNKHDAPSVLFKLLGREKYSKGDAKASVTQLISSPRQVLLKKKHDHMIQVDISDRLYALFGSAVHDMIDRGCDEEDHITEERLFTEVDGWKISGGIDVQRISDNGVKVLDWKVTSVSKIMYGSYEDWEKQLNVYAYLVQKEKNLEVEGLEVCAILRDWKKSDIGKSPNYPSSPIVPITIPLWTYKAQENYIKERIALHKDAARAMEWGEDLPHCTPEETWEKPTLYAVGLPNGKRAAKVYENIKEAEEHVAKSKIPGLAVIVRPGRKIRCEEYCEVSRWCNQFNKGNEE